MIAEQRHRSDFAGAMTLDASVKRIGAMSFVKVAAVLDGPLAETPIANSEQSAALKIPILKMRILMDALLDAGCR